jgi:hypothetical protein
VLPDIEDTEDFEEHTDALPLWPRRFRQRVVLHTDDRTVRSGKSPCRNARRLMTYALPRWFA